MEWLTPREAAHALHLSFVAEDGRPSPAGVALVPERKGRVERRVRFLRVVLAHDEPVRDEFLIRHEVRVAHRAYSFPLLAHGDVLVAERPSSPAAAAGEALNPETPSCRRGQVQRLVRPSSPPP